MDLFYVLLILLVVTRAFGELAEWVGQPALVGELAAGITLGVIVAQYPESFPDLVDLTSNDVFVTVTNLGMFFLMLFAGVEMQPSQIVKYSKRAAVVAFGGMALPLGTGIALGWAFLPESELLPAYCLFIGTALAITAVPATVRILMDLGQLESAVGQTIVSAAVFDDIISLILLAWLTGLLGVGEAPGVLDIALLFGKITLFFGLTVAAGLFLFPLGGKLMRHFKAQELEISALLVSAFAFAVLAELLSLHFIVGAFVAGLFFGRKTIDRESYEKVKSTVSAMTFGFLAPIFFASIGLHLDLDALTGAPIFLLLLIFVAFAGKVIGAGGAARLLGFSKRDSAAIGFGMSPRGAVELVIAGIALQAGLFEGSDNPIVKNLFSSVVVMALVTTVLSPVILKRVFADPSKPSDKLN